MISCSRRSFLLAAGAALSGCVGGDIIPAQGGPSVPAPTYRVGDRWMYRGRDGWRVPVLWDETQEIVAVGPDGIRLRVTQKGPTVDGVREELWTAPGLVSIGAVEDDETRRFVGQLRRFDFPLEPGKGWQQVIRNYNDRLKREGDISRWVRVGGWESVTTPAGTFDAIRMRTSMHLDDDEFWRKASECSYLSWYAPAVRGIVRDEREATYIEGSGRDAAWIRSQHTVLELVSFTAA